MVIRVVRLLCKLRISSFDTITAEATIFDIELYNNKDAQAIGSKHWA